jgi:N-acetylglucosamine-6-sulfatase
MFMRDYLGCVKAVDDNVGRLLDALDRLKLSENTLVVYASDQGFFLGEHGWFDKRWMYEESFFMPLMMRFPGFIRSGSRVDALVQNIDYAPTFCAIAGVAVEKPMHGRSLERLFEGRAPADWRDALYYAYYSNHGHGVVPHEGVATKDHKLLYFPLTGEWEMFERESDPNEMHNLLAGNAQHPLFHEMRRKLEQVRKTYGAPEYMPLLKQR